MREFVPCFLLSFWFIAVHFWRSARVLLHTCSKSCKTLAMVYKNTYTCPALPHIKGNTLSSILFVLGFVFVSFCLLFYLHFTEQDLLNFCCVCPLLHMTARLVLAFSAALTVFSRFRGNMQIRMPVRCTLCALFCDFFACFSCRFCLLILLVLLCCCLRPPCECIFDSFAALVCYPVWVWCTCNFVAYFVCACACIMSLCLCIMHVNILLFAVLDARVCLLRTHTPV